MRTASPPRGGLAEEKGRGYNNGTVSRLGANWRGSPWRCAQSQAPEGTSHSVESLLLIPLVTDWGVSCTEENTIEKTGGRHTKLSLEVHPQPQYITSYYDIKKGDEGSSGVRRQPPCMN